MALKDAYYQVREAETQAFYGLFRAETEARDLDELLAARGGDPDARAAGAGRAAGARRRHRARRAPPAGTAPLHRAARPWTSFSTPHCAAAHASYWSVPFKSGERVEAVVQFGFAKPYPWLPRELHLLDAAAERCLAAVERRRLMADLAAREAEVRRLAAGLIDVEERERRRISRELHDEAGQSMMLLRLELEKLERAAPPAPQQAKLAEVRGIAERTIAEIRRDDRRPQSRGARATGAGGGPAALGGVAREDRAGASVRVQREPGRERLPAAIETVIYRLAQECCQ